MPVLGSGHWTHRLPSAYLSPFVSNSTTTKVVSSDAPPLRHSHSVPAELMVAPRELLLSQAMQVVLSHESTSPLAQASQVP